MAKCARETAPDLKSRSSNRRAPPNARSDAPPGAGDPAWLGGSSVGGRFGCNGQHRRKLSSALGAGRLRSCTGGPLYDQRALSRDSLAPGLEGAVPASRSHGDLRAGGGYVYSAGGGAARWTVGVVRVVLGLGLCCR